MNRRRRQLGWVGRAAAVVLVAALMLAGDAWAQREKKPLTGYEVGPVMDRVVPGEFIVDPSTVQNLGFRWYIEGDSNRNASVAVQFRKKGANAWRPALPMLRVHHEIANQDFEPVRCGNLFAGSVLFLEPDTEYEVRFEMTDPDGGAAPEKTVTVKTRAEPRAPANPRVLHVYPKTHAGATPPGAILGVKAAHDAAKPGDVFLLHAGVYDEGTLTLTKSGEPGKPIILRGAPGEEAILQGTGYRENLIETAEANHVWFEDLTFRKACIAINAGTGRAGSRGLVVRHCTIEDVISGIWGNSKDCADWFISDCVLTGTNQTWYPRPRAYMSPSHTGVNVYGQGIVVCHNRITRFSDALAVVNFGPPPMDPKKQCVSVDFYNNDLSWAQDDTVETDYGCHNIRVYRNRCTNTHTGLSAQPTYGGPVYFIRNEVFGITAKSLKLHNYCAGLEIYHNTFLVAGEGFNSFNKWQNGILRNNLFLGAERYAMETGSITPYTSLDYNGWRKTDDPERFIKWFDGKDWVRYPTLEAFARGAGHEAHGIQVDYDVFVKASMPEAGKTVSPEDYDLRLKEDARAVDAGCVLPNVNDGFAGKAPDLGCHELGAPLPHYGPRR